MLGRTLDREREREVEGRGGRTDNGNTTTNIFVFC
jgi:hypothetical protein